MHTAEGIHAKVVCGAGHVVPAHKQRAPHEAEHDGGEERADEALDGLLRRELDERCPAERYSWNKISTKTVGNQMAAHTPNVRKYIITDNERRRYRKPNQTFEDVVHYQVTKHLLKRKGQS